MTEEMFREFIEHLDKVLLDASLATVLLAVDVIGAVIVGAILWLNVRRHVHRPGRIDTSAAIGLRTCSMMSASRDGWPRTGAHSVLLNHRGGCLCLQPGSDG